MKNSSYFKINLALSVLFRREDGFSEIETVMFPILDDTLCDEIEITLSNSFSFSSSGIEVDCPWEENLCVRAYRIMQSRYKLPDVAIHLHKRIPFGAGLGAGSANATEVLKITNSLFSLEISDAELEDIATELGSDTPFFVKSRSVVARGRGERLSPIEINLSNHYIFFVKPDVGVSTVAAYRAVIPKTPEILPSQAVRYPLGEWQEKVVNDFEEPIFRELPILSQIKQTLIDSGAIYASMSGSGSTIFGIFRDKPTLEFPYFTHCTYIA